MNDAFALRSVRLALSLALVFIFPSLLNAAPLANAGPDQSVTLGATVLLDGSASSDTDGDPLTYRWVFTATPAESVAVLTNENTASPSFVADRAGAYKLQLIVIGGNIKSTPDSVRISTANSAPVAKAGPDQTAFVDSIVALDGTASTDVDGDPLRYQWGFTSTPAESQSVLDNATGAHPSFTVDKPGDYLIELVVSDGQAGSTPDSVQVSSQNSAPVAIAGPGQTVFVNTTVHLDGNGSDDVDADSLRYRWSLLNKPVDSTAALVNDTAVNPSFAVDKPGTYTIQLIVNDGTVDSAPDQVVVSTQNSRPVANAGPNQTAAVGGTVALDGNGSEDADGDPLSFQWSLLSKPADSQASLSGAKSASASFIPDTTGEHVVQLIVSDGRLDSDPDTATVTINVGVRPANQAPRITSSSVTTATVGVAYKYDVEATDPDGDALSYALGVAPGGMTINASSGLVSWAPASEGDFPVHVRVTDSRGASASQSFPVKVSEALVLVPDVVAKTRAQAEAAITAANPSVGKVTGITLRSELALPPAPDYPELALPPAPDYPSIERDMAIVRGGRLQTPTIPAFRTSNDGRVAMDMKGAKRFFLFTPERLTTHFWDSAPGVSLASNTSVVLNGPLHSMPGGAMNHSTLCDGTPQFDIGGRPTQPKACGANDCYDLTHIGMAVQTDSAGRRGQLWGTPIRVTVTNPKTAAATLTVQVRGPPVGGPVFQGVSVLFEPMVTGDGHLLTGRASYSVRDLGTGENVNIVYSMHDDGRAPCDVTGWTQLRAITRAPFDARVKRYGFAQYPFRDAQGNAITPGRDLHASYPWLDRDGRNLFFTVTNATLYYQTSGGSFASRFPARCPTGVACNISLEAGFYMESREADTRGTAVMGLWTHGRAVLLDGAVNHLDYGLPVSDRGQREILLYAPGTGRTGSESGWVLAGTGRDVSSPQFPAAVPRNTTFIESLENLFNANASMRTRTPRDVVWMVNSQLATEEIVFDDWLNPHALIVSDMMPSWTYNGRVYHDGFQRGVGFSASASLRMQNAATAPPELRAVPRFGLVEGPGRAEPVALGGIFGRGLFMADRTRLTYDIPAAPQENQWFISLFLDARIPADNAIRRVLSFPDGTSLLLQGRGTFLFRDAAGTERARVQLPPQLGFGLLQFRHVALRTSQAGRSLDLLIDGYAVATVNVPAPGLFRFPAGRFVVGALSQTDQFRGVRGWIDELRVFAENVGPELACNHARGSLVGLTPSAPASLRAQAALFPAANHLAISQQLTAVGRPTFQQYVCLHDYTRDRGVALGALPAGVVSIRSALLFPEGPLHFGSPRPDSGTNAFCLGCHVSGHPNSLSPAALGQQAFTMEQDRRRQPLQPPRLIFGRVPANFFGPNQPAAPISDVQGGALMDQWTFP